MLIYPFSARWVRRQLARAVAPCPQKALPSPPPVAHSQPVRSEPEPLAVAVAALWGQRRWHRWGGTARLPMPRGGLGCPLPENRADAPPSGAEGQRGCSTLCTHGQRDGGPCCTPHGSGCECERTPVRVCVCLCAPGRAGGGRFKACVQGCVPGCVCPGVRCGAEGCTDTKGCVQAGGRCVPSHEVRVCCC